jgi:thiol:disulfide interchange protein
MSDEPSQAKRRSPAGGNLLVALLLIFAVGGLYAYVTRPARTPVGWSEDFAAAKEQAAREGRPMFVDFSATWCPPCNQMARDVLPVRRVADALKGFITVHVDVDKDKDLAASFRVEVLPTFIVLSPQGREVYRFEGYRSADDLLRELAEARKRL